MERPTITIEDKNYEIRDLVCGDWGILGKFRNSSPKFFDADLTEKHAEFIANFFDITKEEILNKMALQDILPATRDIQSYMIQQLSVKLKEIEKNVPEDEAAQ